MKLAFCDWCLCLATSVLFLLCVWSVSATSWWCRLFSVEGFHHPVEDFARPEKSVLSQLTLDKFMAISKAMKSSKREKRKLPLSELYLNGQAKKSKPAEKATVASNPEGADVQVVMRNVESKPVETSQSEETKSFESKPAIAPGHTGPLTTSSAVESSLKPVVMLRRHSPGAVTNWESKHVVSDGHAYPLRSPVVAPPVTCPMPAPMKRQMLHPAASDWNRVVTLLQPRPEMQWWQHPQEEVFLDNVLIPNSMTSVGRNVRCGPNLARLRVAPPHVAAGNASLASNARLPVSSLPRPVANSVSLGTSPVYAHTNNTGLTNRPGDIMRQGSVHLMTSPHPRGESPAAPPVGVTSQSLLTNAAMNGPQLTLQRQPLGAPVRQGAKPSVPLTKDQLMKSWKTVSLSSGQTIAQEQQKQMLGTQVKLLVE